MVDNPNKQASTRRRRRDRLRRRVAAIVLLLLLVALAADYALFPRLARPAGAAPRTATNGVWLHHSWYFGDHADAESARLARRLEGLGIRDAYFHTRFITDDGSLRYRRPTPARRLIREVHRAAPSVRAIAWVFAGNPQGMGAVDLSRPPVRRRMVAEAVWLTTVCGFDGVQWDYEICPDGDAHLLALLRETRAALPPGKVLSVATPLWVPRPVNGHGWTEGTFEEAARYCDQVVVMGYDSALYLPRAYAALMGAQVVHVTRAVARGNPACQVLIGVPTYEKGGASHHARAESLRMALLGVRRGLSDPRAERAAFAGIAPFADYTTDEVEWSLYRRWWLGRDGPGADIPAREGMGSEGGTLTAPTAGCGVSPRLSGGIRR